MARVYQSPEEAAIADREYHRSLTPDERVELLMELKRQVDGDEQRFERVVRIVLARGR